MASLPSIDPDTQTKDITAFIKDTVSKNGKKAVVIGLSGGIDSGLALILTVQALGPKHVHVFHLPSAHTPTDHSRLAGLIVSTVQIPPDNYRTIPTSAIIQKAWRIIKHYGQDTHHPTKPNYPHRQKAIGRLTRLNRLRLANLTARIRMTILFDQAKARDGLVIGTENLSEHLLGYYTRYGDQASDIEPIRHLYKTQVYQLARHLDLPQEVINQPPSAGLWPGQTDAQELGFSYEQADPILYLLKQEKTADQIIKEGHPQDLVTAVTHVVSQNAFKPHVPYSLK